MQLRRQTRFLSPICVNYVQSAVANNIPNTATDKCLRTCASKPRIREGKYFASVYVSPVAEERICPSAAYCFIIVLNSAHKFIWWLSQPNERKLKPIPAVLDFSQGRRSLQVVSRNYISLFKQYIQLQSSSLIAHCVTYSGGSLACVVLWAEPNNCVTLGSRTFKAVKIPRHCAGI